MKYILFLLLSLFTFNFNEAHAATNNSEIRCLAKNMYYEARGEGYNGMLAVGHVVMNRVESKKFASSACSVIYQRSRTTCQFSWVCKRSNARVNNEQYDMALILAKKIYSGNSKDITGGALFFHNTSVRPYWSRVFKRTARIGNHTFYRG